MTEDEKQLWAIAIGNFIIEFGGMEALVTEVVRRSVAAVHFDVLRKLQFERRASLAFASLQALHTTQVQSLADDFKLLDAIRGRRNLVAHSGFTVSFYTNADQSEFRFEFGMADAYKKNAVFVQIQHLEQDTLALKAVYARLLPLLPSGVVISTGGAEGARVTHDTNSIWVGPDFAKRRILVLGESWYGDYADNTDAGYVRNYLDGNQRDAMYTRMSNATGMGKRDFWNSIAFTNYVQRIGDTRKDRPSVQAYKDATERLIALIEVLEPSGVWVLGMEQSKFSVPVLQRAGVTYEVTAHPTSYGLSNAKLGESWARLNAAIEEWEGIHQRPL